MTALLDFDFSEMEDVCDGVIQKLFSSITTEDKYQMIYYLAPSLIQWINFIPHKEDVLSHFVEMCVDKISHTDIPISNSKSLDCPGTHWSLMIYEKSSNTYYHFDSIKYLNTNFARRTAQNLHSSLEFQENFSFEEVPCYQQQKGIDCGLHVVHNAMIASEVILNGSSLSNNQNFLSPFSVSDLRKNFDCPNTKNLHKSKLQPTASKGFRNKNNCYNDKFKAHESTILINTKFQVIK